MLTTDDKKFIQEAIKNAFQDFYENIFEPHAQQLDDHLEKSDRDYKEFVRQMNSIKSDSSRVQDAVYELTLIVKDHEKRMQKLESIQH